MSENNSSFRSTYQGFSGRSTTRGGDFGSALLILFAAVMKADNELKKTELDFIKKFLIQQFNINYAKDRIQLFKEILIFWKSFILILE